MTVKKLEKLFQGCEEEGKIGVLSCLCFSQDSNPTEKRNNITIKILQLGDFPMRDITALNELYYYYPLWKSFSFTKVAVLARLCSF